MSLSRPIRAFIKYVSTHDATSPDAAVAARIASMPTDLAAVVQALATHDANIELSGFSLRPDLVPDGVHPHRWPGDKILGKVDDTLVVAVHELWEQQVLFAWDDEGNSVAYELDGEFRRVKRISRQALWWVSDLLDAPVNADTAVVAAVHAALGSKPLRELSMSAVANDDFADNPDPIPPDSITAVLDSKPYDEVEDRRGKTMGAGFSHYRLAESGRWVFFAAKGVRFVADNGKRKSRNVKDRQKYTAVASDGSFALLSDAQGVLNRVDIPSAEVTRYEGQDACVFALLDNSHVVTLRTEKKALTVYRMEGADLVKVQKLTHASLGSGVQVFDERWVLSTGETSLVWVWRNGSLQPYGALPHHLRDVRMLADGRIAASIGKHPYWASIDFV